MKLAVGSCVLHNPRIFNCACSSAAEPTAPVGCVVRAAQLGLQVQVGQNLSRVERKLDQVGLDTEGLFLERRASKVSRG